MDLEQTILDAWRRVEPRLRDDPHDLARRLARRALPVLTRPPRAWCIAVRASDARLPRGDDVTLDRAALAALCAPVHVEWPGQTCDEIANKLGTTPMGLRAARINGVFRVRHIPGLGGRHGRPIPILYTDQPLDPAARNFAVADPLWSWTARHLAAGIPRNFVATLQRVPCYRPIVARHRYAEHIHPELRHADGLDVLKRRGRRLPEPEPDYVWYKWSRPRDGSPTHYLGDDPSNWRKSPDDRGERPARWRSSPSPSGRGQGEGALGRRSARRRKAAPARAQGSLQFTGHKWLCPACGKTCRTIYYPLPPINLLKHAQPRLAKLVGISRQLAVGSRQRGNDANVGDASAPPTAYRLPPTAYSFACSECLRLRHFSRVAHDAWNALVSYVSAGLLYGHEVPRPPELDKRFREQGRKRAYRPRPNAKPSLRRPQVTELLLGGLTYAQIAARLGVKPVTITSYARRVYASHGVQGRAELAKKLGRPDPRPTTRSRVRQLLEAGNNTRAIADRLGISRKAVNDHAYMIRRAHSCAASPRVADPRPCRAAHSLTHNPAVPR